MAKLNVVVPAVNVLVDGVEYRKVERAAQAGDIVKALVKCIDVTEGAFYNVHSDIGGLFFYDDDGDRRHRFGGGHVGSYEVYEKVGVQPESTYNPGDVVRTKSGMTTTLTERAPKYDDLFGFGLAWKHTHDGGWLGEEQFELVLVAPVEDVIVHEGRRYRKVARKANVGELIIATSVGSSNGRHVKVGEIGVVTGRRGWVAADIHVNFTCGKEKFIGPSAGDSEYAVLEPLAPAKPAQTPRLKVGEYAKVNEGAVGSVGSFVGKIVQLTSPSDVSTLDGKHIGPVYASELTRATDDEISAARAEIERKKAEEEVEAKWNAIGRKVNEYKRGDIVRGERSLERGSIVTGAYLEGSDSFVKHGITSFVDGNYRSIIGSTLELVTPVEQRFDR
jgi:hypothetical protein